MTGNAARLEALASRISKGTASDGDLAEASYELIMMNRKMRIVQEILDERKRQDGLWGQQNHEDVWWYAILMEEVGEVSESMLAEHFGGNVKMTTREELVQVAAVALAWLECMDRRP